MSVALEVALLLAAVAFIVLVAVVIPFVLQARRQLDHLMVTADQLKNNLDVLVHDIRELVQSVNELSTQASRQMADVSRITGLARKWADRADLIANEVSSIIEPPVLSLVRTVNMLRSGAGAFFQHLFHSRQHQHTNEEESHV